MNSISPTIYLDMDEVVADFTGGVCRLFGITRSQLERHRKPGEWYIPPALTLACGYEVTYETVGDEIAKWGSKFWSNLAALPMMDSIIALAETVDPEWCFLSTPWYHHGNHLPSTTGKIEWLHNQFHEDFDRYILTGKKSRCAHVGSILIDDRERNCIDFCIDAKGNKREGVYSILVPHEGNSLGKTYTTAEQRLAYLEVQLNLVLDSISKL